MSIESDYVGQNTQDGSADQKKPELIEMLIYKQMKTAGFMWLEDNIQSAILKPFPENPDTYLNTSSQQAVLLSFNARKSVGLVRLDSVDEGINIYLA